MRERFAETDSKRDLWRERKVDKGEGDKRSRGQA